MDSRVVRSGVKAFRERTAFGGATEHCFAPWYLHSAFQMNETAALQQASDGNFDFGIDAFCLPGGKDATSLVLIQAKFTESIPQITTGFKDFERALKPLASALESGGAEISAENKVLINLRAALNRMSPESRKDLRLDFHLLHLSDEDSTVFGQKVREKRTRLREAIEHFFPDRTCTIREVGPKDLGPPTEVVAPPPDNFLQLDAQEVLPLGTATRMVWGIGRLCDLVEVYRVRRDHLFSRNVRYYLFGKQNVEKGPAGKMRESLKKICIEKTIAPETFALYHNGITLHASRIQPVDGGVRIADPFVLNGCQSIKNAFFFRNDQFLRQKIDDERWKQVRVPLRIIETRDEDLVRTITVNNNRQNAISFAALRANDPVQIRLEERFKDVGIFYERQTGAFDNLEATSPEVLEDEYERSRGRCVDMTELARALAATAGEIGIANRPNELFESDAAYARCFSEKKRLLSVTLLTFLQNVDDVIGVILKRDLNLSPQSAGPRPSRLKYHVICLLMRFLAREKQAEFITEYGTALFGKHQEFRDALTTELKSKRSGIRDALARNFMKLKDADAASINAAFERTQKELKLQDNIDPFAVFADLDEHRYREEEIERQAA